MSSMDSPNMPRTGDVIDGKYVLLRILGKGGMGIVFEAKHTRLPGHVAIKFLLKTNWNGPLDRERFIGEAHAGRKLTSEHSVRVTDMGEFAKVPGDDSLPYIVMEYLQGKDLDAFVEMNGPLAVATAVDHILQACIALAEAHAKNISHRDLKPSNLFLTKRVDGSPLVKVLDFGLAKDTAPSATAGASRTTTGFIMLSPGYAPPEQQKGLRHADKRSDIYSINACLYFLLARRCPFTGSDLHDVMIAVARDPPTPLGLFRQDVPRPLVDLIEQCLAKSPTARPQTITEFAVALAPFGSPDALRLVESVKQTALLTAQQVAPEDDDKATVKYEPPPQPRAAPPVADSLTVPLQNQAQPQQAVTSPPDSLTVPLQPRNHLVANPQPGLAPQPGLVPQPKRQTNVRAVVVASVAAAVVATMVAVVAAQFLTSKPPETVNPPMTSAAPLVSAELAPVTSAIVDTSAAAPYKSAPLPSSTSKTSKQMTKTTATTTGTGPAKTVETQKGYKKF